MERCSGKSVDGARGAGAVDAGGSGRCEETGGGGRKRSATFGDGGIGAPIRRPRPPRRHAM
jgi:hypothetical protein